MVPPRKTDSSKCYEDTRIDRTPSLTLEASFEKIEPKNASNPYVILYSNLHFPDQQHYEVRHLIHWQSSLPYPR
jgi:hypothetical protein